MHEEQSGEGQRPEAWSAWSTPAGQSEPSDAPGHTSGAAQPGDQNPQPGQHGAFTQPIGYPADGYGQQSPQPGQQSPQPGQRSPQPGQQSPQPGQYSAYPPPPPPPFGQPGGYTSYGQPGEYGQAGGYGPPGGYGYTGYGQPGGYGPPRRRVANAIVYIAVAAVAATAGGLTVYASSSHNAPAASSGTSGGGNTGGSGNVPNFQFPGQSGGNTGGNSGGGSVGSSPVSQATATRVKDAVLPGLVTISGNLKYQGDADAATGMVISSSGLVLTNNHVINGTTGLSAVVVSTGQRFSAKWLGYDKSSDVAVIQLVGASGLRTVPLGNSNSVKVGDGVVAMGNANGTGGIATVTGQVTGLNKSITATDDGSSDSENLKNMVETDADIIPGDSGGPLASTSGKVIGMDTAASTNAIGYGSQTVGFAIPINRAMSIAQQIISGHSSSVVRVGSAGFLGVLVTSGSNGQQSTDPNPSGQLQQQEQAENQNGGFGGTQYPPSSSCLGSDASAGIPSKIAPVSSGTLVLGSLCGTPASSAGLGIGDVITRLNGESVGAPSSLVGILGNLHSGQSVSITWVTPSDVTMNRSMTLIAAPPD
jgi:S1-C subfamily serine protease